MLIPTPAEIAALPAPPWSVLTSGCLVDLSCASEQRGAPIPALTRLLARPEVRIVPWCSLHGDPVALARSEQVVLALLLDSGSACASQVGDPGPNREGRHAYGGEAAARLFEAGIPVVGPRDLATLEALLFRLDPTHRVDETARDLHDTPEFQARFVGDVPALEARVREWLDTLPCVYSVLRHPPVFTVAEARRWRGVLPDAKHVKNLFLRDKKGAMYLVVLEAERIADLRALRTVVGSSGTVTFASPERLQTHLGVLPGSVTPIAALNDRDGKVRVFVDEALREGRIAVHPLHNAATVVLEAKELWGLLERHGHPVAFFR